MDLQPYIDFCVLNKATPALEQQRQAKEFTKLELGRIKMMSGKLS